MNFLQPLLQVTPVENTVFDSRGWCRKEFRHDPSLTHA
jgi:hypothetical protein